MEYPKIKPQFMITSYGNKISIGSTPGISVEIIDKDGYIFEVLKLCNGEHDATDIYMQLRRRYDKYTLKDVKDIISNLASQPYLMEDNSLLIEDPLSDYMKVRHSRTMNFLSNFGRRGTQKIQYMKKIMESRVLVVGLGGVGSSIVFDLAALGVSYILGIDFDKVDLSNLNRQILYDELDIDLLKTKRATRKIKQFNSNIKFETLNKKLKNSIEIIKIIEENNIDFVFCAADQPPILIYRWMNEACLQTNTPWIYGGNSEATSYLQAIIPHVTSCFMCKEKDILDRSNDAKLKYHFIEDNGYDLQNNCLAASSACLASFMIFEFIKIITKCDKPLATNRMMLIDYRDYTIHFEELPLNEECGCSESLY